MTSEVVHLSTKNEELCQELSEIDHLAQQLERHKEIVLETADKEIGEAKVSKYYTVANNLKPDQLLPKLFLLASVGYLRLLLLRPHQHAGKGAMSPKW